MKNIYVSILYYMRYYINIYFGQVIYYLIEQIDEDKIRSYKKL